jgi:hypothetical protein
MKRYLGAMCLLLCSAPLVAEKERNTVSFTVAQVALDAPINEVRATLARAGFALTTNSISLRDKPEMQYPERIMATSSASKSPIIHDRVVVWFTHPPSAPRVLAVHRETAYQRDGAPLLADYFDLAKQKAGFEVYRRSGGYNRSEQLIRWRPDGKPLSSFGKLLSNLPSSSPTIDPCIANFDLGDPRFRGISEMTTSPTGAWSKGWYDAQGVPFASFANCGTTYTALVAQDGSGFANSTRVLLIDQTSAADDAVKHEKWIASEARELQLRRKKAAAKPEI